MKYSTSLFGQILQKIGTLVALLRLNLFSYRNLQDWLDDPFQTPAEHPPKQMKFVFGTASAATGV